MSGYSVNPGDVGSVAQAMAQANQAINDRMSMLLSQLTDLPDLWQGPASAAFHRAMASWQTKAVTHSQRLSDIAKALETTHGNYLHTEDANQDGVTRYQTNINS
jgi:WXG100 family type VII secretion target